MKKIIAGIVCILIIYLIATTIPYIKPKKITDDKKKEIQATLQNSQFKEESVTLIKDSHDALDIRLAMIQNAKESIDMSYYIIQEGETSDQVLAELIHASKRGVKVRVLVDGKVGGLNNKRGRYLSSFDNIDVYVYNPVNLLKPFELQSVHHEKYLIIDDSYSLVGGRNIGDRYFKYDEEYTLTVDDLDVFVHNEKGTSELAIALSSYMDDFLDNAPIKKISPKRKGYKKDLESINNDSKSLNSYINKSTPAKRMSFIANPYLPKDTSPVIPFVFSELVNESEEIMFQTPYLTANKYTLETLNANKGKKITLLTNSVASSSNYPAFSNYSFHKKKFINTGMDIFEYQSSGNHSLHTKAYIFDDYVSIGSFNLDDRSFFINTELMLLVDAEGLKDELIESFKIDLNESYQVAGEKKNIGLDNPYKVSFFKKALMSIFGLLSNLYSFLV